MRTGRPADWWSTPRAWLNHGSQAWDANSSTSSEKTVAAGRPSPRTAKDRRAERLRIICDIHMIRWMDEGACKMNRGTEVWFRHFAWTLKWKQNPPVPATGISLRWSPQPQETNCNDTMLWLLLTCGRNKQIPRQNYSHLRIKDKVDSIPVLLHDTIIILSRF